MTTLQYIYIIGGCIGHWHGIGIGIGIRIGYTIISGESTDPDRMGGMAFVVFCNYEGGMRRRERTLVVFVVLEWCI